MSHTIDRAEPSSPSSAPRAGARGRRWLVVLVVIAVIGIGGYLLQVALGPSSNRNPAILPPDAPVADEGARLTWAPPALEAPEVINVTEDDTSLRLEDDQDYWIVLPDEPLVSDRGLTIKGGEDVVLIGGRIEAEDRALYLIDQTGTLHIEGLSLGGEDLREGINLDQREGATVQLQNISVDMVTGTADGHHADLLQTWAGPERLRIDGFTGTTGYQGFFLLPRQFGDEDPEEWDFRRVVLTGDEDAAYLLWTHDDAPWLSTTDVHVVPSEDKARRYVLEGDLDDVAVGPPPTTVQMPAGEPGVGYESPGYVGADD
ncbi:hypothetical protein [Blastococcus montanus]|uniref:hypothetical protein n=1 Tax=Blastococcus montanus TaxID=3144973 RepID=UPI0032088C30